MTKTLDTLRAEIDEVDAKLVAALAKRTHLVAEVAAAKAAGSAIFRPGREADLKMRLWRLAPQVSQALIEPVWRPLLRASIASQKPDFTLAFPPEAETAAEVFSAGFLHLREVHTARDGLELLLEGTADICFISQADLRSICHMLGTQTGLYIVAKEGAWMLLAKGMPDRSQSDMTILIDEIEAGKNTTDIEFIERSGYFEVPPDDMPDAHIIGIYQILEL